MTEEAKRPLKVFLCHASGDKAVVRELYRRLIAEGVDAWLDQEKLLPGQDWRVEIPRAVSEADVVVICLSNKSITKEGYVQKEIRFALDSAEEKPEGTIFLIPARLEECTVPERLDRWQWVDLYEENGFIRLLRSLKIRANVLGATIEPSGYESEDQETEHRLDQLYTEGLAAFWVEDWDRACQRFQMILRERPNYKNTAEKLAEAERQRSLAKLYALATEAYQSEQWPDAIKALAELLEKSADYKDAVSLLKEAKKRRQLGELYEEAKRLHAAQKWPSVIKVFEHIVALDPHYPDPENLLPSAQQQAAELRRQEQLNNLYRQGLHYMDAGNWYEARNLLEQVHKAQTGFLDTERLLRKVENEITKVEELTKRNDRINILYEQAHGLIRSKSWRMVLDKMEEIQRLDDHFVDKDGIFEKAKTELDHEEQAAQQQNELAAIYAESVRLLKEEKYQDALDKWQEVRTVDPKYPDRQWVQRTARKKLMDGSKSSQGTRHFSRTKLVSAGLIALLVIGLAIVVVQLSRSPDFISSISSVPYRWDFDNNAQGWGYDFIYDMTITGPTDGVLMFKTTGADPYVHSPVRLNISASQTPIITLRMRIMNGQGSRGAILFLTDQDREWGGDKYVHFPISTDGAFHIYNILMSQNPDWNGVVNQIRLDPIDDLPNAVEPVFEIDYILVRGPFLR